MPEKREPKNFLPAILALVSFFKDSKAKASIIGGIAVSLLGEPRLTKDVDAMMIYDVSLLQRLMIQLSGYGFKSRRADYIKFGQQTRMLLLEHQATGVEVDLSLGVTPFEEELVSRIKKINFEGIKLPLPHVDDLIIMKAVAHRSQDLLDIESLIKVHKKIDTKRTCHWIAQYAEVLENPEILEDFEKILKRVKK